MDQLRATMEALGVDARVLLLRAQHEEMKEHVRTVQRDLAGALALLDKGPSYPELQSLLTVVDLALRLAAIRLQMVEFALRTKGPNASEIS